MATSFFGKFYPSRTQSNQRPKINIRNQRENTGPSTISSVNWQPLNFNSREGSSINIDTGLSGALAITLITQLPRPKILQWNI